MNKSTKLLLASVSPVALAAGWMVLDSAPAHATITVGAFNGSYASENFVGASAASIINVGTSGITLTTGTTSTDFATGFLTFTLSNSTTFVAAPSTATTNISLGTGSLTTGSTAVVYQVTTAPTTTTPTITLGNFSIGGVGTRLATSNQTIKVTYASNGSNVPAAATATVAFSSQAYTFTAPSNGNTVSIDLANSGSGVVFRTAAPSSNVSFATLGSLLQAAAAAGNDIGGTTAFTATASDVLRATVNGNLSAFSSVYASTAACAATAPSGAISGTISGNTATISPLIQATTYNICAIASGTAIIPSGTITASATYLFAARTVSGTTYTPSAYGQSSSTLATLTYNGSVNTAYYVVGAGSYASAIRLTNPSTSSGSVFVQVTPDTTGTPVRALLDSTLAAGQSKFYFASDIRTAVGTSVLADSNTRATVVFLNSFSNGQVQNFILNPGGVLSGGTSVGSGNTTGN